jgi:hypothetical protein
VEQLKFTRQDINRILACVRHAALCFDVEAARQRQITVALAGHPLGLLSGVVSEVMADLFTDEGEQLRQLHTKLEQAINASASKDTDTQPGEQKDGTSGPFFE